ncbi:MAG: L-lactate permease [Candidatus Promineifilaceae bacterium]
MTLPPSNLLTLVAAFLPLSLVLYLMIGRHWGATKAGPAGWLSAVLIALIIYGANGLLLVVAFGRALLLALYVLYIIWMALLLYHTVNEAGAIALIGRELPALARSQTTQALLLGWVFGSFLQGASGFGVPAAVVAPLLVGLGFAANQAVVIALLGHAWAVTFGSLGSSFFSLIAATGQPGEALAGPAALLLAFCCLACGTGVAWEAGGWNAIRRDWLLLLVISGVMSAVQAILALAGLWSLAAFGAGLAGLIVILLWLRLSAGRGKAAMTTDRGTLATAVFPYVILILVIVTGQLILQAPLDTVLLNPTFPEVKTSFGWITAAGGGRSISIFGHAGALLLYASLLSFLWFRLRGTPQSDAPYEGKVILQKTLKGSIKPTIGIISLVAMAVTMQHAGMTQRLAEALSVGTGPIFPFLSSFIGALGAFMTGSNTNSNVVFGSLQQQTASVLNLTIPVILAAQTAGGAIGSMFAPAKVVVGCSTVPGASDGEVLKKVTLYGLGITALIGIIVWLWV